MRAAAITVLERERIDALFDALVHRGYTVVGPTLGDGAIVYDELRDRCEQAIRNRDPCISCVTHFLMLEVERS